MREVVIVSAARTAVGGFGQSLKDVPVVKLGGLVIKEALKRAGLRPSRTKDRAFAPEIFAGKLDTELEAKYYDFDASLKEVEVDEVIMGNVLQAGLGQNSARQAAIQGGMPKETNAYTVNKVCASGLRAIANGAQAIMAGDADVIIAGGMENMSLCPYALPAARFGARMFNSEMVDLMVLDGVWEIFYGYHMGVTAENIAEKFGIGREEQDSFGLMSHQRARQAIKEGWCAPEIVPVVIPQKKGEPLLFQTDERPMETSLEKMAKLGTAFKKDGTVTAGNASGLNDAAAAVVLMSREKAREMGIKPMGRIVSYAAGGVDPAYMGLGPVPAVKKALKRAGLTLDQIDMVELNEAFASQAISNIRELKLDLARTNMHGGGISIGHPIGCTGARLITTLMYQMPRLGLKYGLATMCIGGGQGMAMVVEREIDMSYENVILEVQDSIGFLKINRPKALNALNTATLDDLSAAAREVACNDAVRVVIVTGVGKAFVAGADIQEMQPMKPMEAAAFSQKGHLAISMLERMSKPVIAAVNGYALGGGLEVALACDIIYASEKARMGFPEVTLGILPGFGGTQRTARLIGLARAKELIFTGKVITANDAYAMGLVNKVVPDEQLMEAASELAAKMLSAAPVGIQLAKACVNRSADLDIDSGLDFEADAFGLCFGTEDQKEGMSAFLEKRTPTYRGK